MREVGRLLNEYVEENLGASKIREDLDKYFTAPNDKERLAALDDEEVKEFAMSVRRGVHFATPVFEGALEADIDQVLEKCGQDISGQSVLFDGRTGEPFDQAVTVGVMYVLKLHHLVDDKIHARSIGPYSLVPSSHWAVAQFGGQRLGEMEVWAMEAYGASYALQEFLTVKSDDVQGRTRMYEAIVKGENTLAAGLPESFNVLTKELQALCLDVEMLSDDDGEQSSSILMRW